MKKDQFVYVTYIRTTPDKLWKAWPTKIGLTPGLDCDVIPCYLSLAAK